MTTSFEDFYDSLSGFSWLSPTDSAAISALASLPWTRDDYAVREKLRHRDRLIVVTSGWIARCHVVPGGRQQLLALYFPGDICSYSFLTGPHHRSSLIALTRSTIWSLSPSRLLPAIEHHPSIMRAILDALGTDHAVSEEHLITLGSRNALGRMAHFISEVHCRLAIAGNVEDGTFEFPMTQPELGEYLSLSSVHVNRTLQALRRRGLITLTGKKMHLSSPADLARVADFDEGYLRSPNGPEPRQQPLSSFAHLNHHGD